MGSSPKAAPALPTPAFCAAFRARAGTAPALRFDDFVALALYDPAVGYYRRDTPRVGYGPSTDFFTASSSGPWFGELVAASCAGLLAGRPAAAFTFVELGAEAAGGVLAGLAHPFGAVRTVRLGEPFALTGPCIVFSNELFDAQPFRRFAYRRGAWWELGVAENPGPPNSGFIEVELGRAAHPALPAGPAEGDLFDGPFAAATLAGEIADQPWTGLFIACDYGKSWAELNSAAPTGTARAYHRHQQSGELLARPGEQDLTCHICWDWLADELARRGFANPTWESQEAFFVHHAGPYLAAVTAAEAGRFSARKRALSQLLHPAHLGQKFQVMHAWRD